MEVSNRDTIPIALLFEGEPLNFSYSKIGLVELTGNQSGQTVLSNFKYQAWKNGGNALLLIKKNRIQTRNSSTTDSCGNTTIDTQYANRWTGMITQIPDSIYYLNITASDTNNYVQIVEKNAVNTRPNRLGNFLIGYTLVSCIGLLILAYSLE